MIDPYKIKTYRTCARNFPVRNSGKRKKHVEHAETRINSRGFDSCFLFFLLLSSCVTACVPDPYIGASLPICGLIELATTIASASHLVRIRCDSRRVALLFRSHLLASLLFVRCAARYIRSRRSGSSSWQVSPPDEYLDTEVSSCSSEAHSRRNLKQNEHLFPSLCFWIIYVSETLPAIHQW